jgi:hypothetical protein
MLKLGDILNGTFINILNNDSSCNANIWCSRPGHGHGVIDMKLSHLRETPCGQGPTVGDFEGPQIVFCIFINDIDHVLLVDISLLEAQGLILVGIVSQFQGRRAFIDATIFFVMDITRFAGTNRFVGLGDGTNFVFACVVENEVTNALV